MSALFGKVEPESKMDRGLARGIVQAYANSQGITYEDAHQIRSKGKAKPEVPTVAPNKWELSRKDEVYRQHRAQECKLHLQRIRSEFGV